MASTNPVATGDRNLVTNMAREDLRYIIETQVSYANYLLPTEQSRPGRDRTFGDNENIWSAILSGSLRANMFVTLENFVIFEWFPRSPGLFFTPKGRESRQKAAQFVESLEKRGSEAQYALASSEDRVTVYNPHGKAEMLKGGLGAIRLMPRPISSSEDWFMCASSNGVAHEGFPLLLPTPLYDDCIDEIAGNRVCRRTVVGKLQFVSDPIVTLYDYPDVPKLYLQVEELRPADSEKGDGDNELAVSVGVSFESSYEGVPKVYASYVYFNPTRPESFKRNVGWMEETYIEGRYKGKIITDFDEHMRRFADATFSLSKVMDYSLDQEQVEQTLKRFGMSGEAQKLLSGQQIRVERLEVTMGDRIDITGQAVGVGRGAQANNVNLNQVWNERAAGIDLVALSSELEQLRRALREEPETVERDSAIGIVAGAELAAKEGDGPTALERLAKAGKWVFDVAEKIGTTVAAAAIKSALGF